LKLYYSPGACSLGIHALLEELGVPYEKQLVSLKDGEHRKPAYIAVNPKAKIPALQRDDGSILTEWPAIATWLARTNPMSAMIPQDPDAEARALEAVDYIVSTMHMQGFARMVRPENFGPSASDQDAVKARGLEIFTNGFKLIDRSLEGREYLAGAYSIADTALLFVCNWANRVQVPLPANVAAHYARMKQRPAVQRALTAEGIAL
jgi:glutathione S-transferase